MICLREISVDVGILDAELLKHLPIAVTVE